MIVPTKTYYRIAIAYVNLGPFNIFVAMTIAVIKAVLVVLYLMRVRYGAPADMGLCHHRDVLAGHPFLAHHEQLSDVVVGATVNIDF